MKTRTAMLFVIGLAACHGTIGGGPGDDSSSTTDGGGPNGDPPDPSFAVTLVPQDGVSGVQRVSFAIPLPAGLIDDVGAIRISAGGTELATARRGLATWGDGSLRSVQLQVEVDPTAVLDVEVGAPATAGSLDLVAVAETLVAADGTQGPRVWAVLPAAWLAASQVAGPLVEDSLGAFVGVCDYATWDTEAFLAVDDDRGSWLYDRATAMYRGYAITGSRDALASGYREAAIYRASITGTGHDTRIGVPTAADDLKYHYAQGMAVHYLLTGDDRFREAAENVAIRTHDLWPSPGYSGGDDFWTERHAGFALLAYEWAAEISDDQAATFAGWADEAVPAYLAMQADAAGGWEADARCFAHSATSAGEDFGYVGCSPWMSAILADGLDAYARRVGGSRGDDARAAIVSLGRMIARHGLDDAGKPTYWMGAGVDQSEIDEYDEHWGEPAYVVAMAWHHSGRTDTALRDSATALLDGLRTQGEAGQLRSFNWQCRSAPAAAYFLR